LTNTGLDKLDKENAWRSPSCFHTAAFRKREEFRVEELGIEELGEERYRWKEGLIVVRLQHLGFNMSTMSTRRSGETYHRRLRNHRGP